eukprot:scaffold8631_cov28-Tisochrysis_lutea.AAC.6
MIGLRVHLESSSGAGLATALKWIRRALFLTEISPADARMGAQRLANEIPAQVSRPAGCNGSPRLANRSYAFPLLDYQPCPNSSQWVLRSSVSMQRARNNRDGPSRCHHLAHLQAPGLTLALSVVSVSDSRWHDRL